MTTTWLGVWTRAVIGPAYRRAGAVWAGCMIVGAIIFGPTAMHPRDITRIALHEPRAGLVLGGTWLLVFVPIARALLHADEARFLRSLPAPAILPRLVQIGAIVVLQLPWLLLWLVGAQARGLVVFAGSTVITCAIAWWRPSRIARGTPAWRSPLRALFGVYLAALARRAGDALVRGAGLAIFAGLAGGLFVRNNVLAGEHAARIAASVIALMAVPAQAGVLGVLLDAHRRSTWLARSLGVSPSTRVFALVGVLALLHAIAALLATAAASVVLVTAAPVAHTNIPEVAFAEVEPSTIVWIALTCLACAIASGIGAARIVLGADARIDELASLAALSGAASSSATSSSATSSSATSSSATASSATPSSAASRAGPTPSTVALRMAIASLGVAVATIAALTLLGALAGAIAIVVITSFFLARVDGAR
jgi:hypothetical protein